METVDVLSRSIYSQYQTGEMVSQMSLTESSQVGIFVLPSLNLSCLCKEEYYKPTKSRWPQAIRLDVQFLFWTNIFKHCLAKPLLCLHHLSPESILYMLYFTILYYTSATEMKYFHEHTSGDR